MCIPLSLNDGIFQYTKMYSMVGEIMSQLMMGSSVFMITPEAWLNGQSPLGSSSKSDVTSSKKESCF